MATLKGKSTISSVLGQEVSPIEFEYEYETFDNIADAKSAGKWPNDADILKVVNATEQRNAMSKERAAASQREAERIQGTREYKVSQIVSAMVKAGVAPDNAKAIAESQVPA